MAPPRGSHTRRARGRAAGLEHGPRLVEVVRRHDPGRRALEDRQVELAVTIEVRQRDLGDRPVGVAAEEEEVEDADQPSVHEIDDVVQALTGASAGGELDDEIVYRSSFDASPSDGPDRVSVASHMRDPPSDPV